MSKEGLENAERREFWRDLFDIKSGPKALRGLGALRAFGNPTEGERGFEDAKNIRGITRRRVLAVGGQAGLLAAIVGGSFVAPKILKMFEPEQIDDFEGLNLEPDKAESLDQQSIPPKIARINQILMGTYEDGSAQRKAFREPSYKQKVEEKLKGSEDTAYMMWLFAFRQIEGLCPDNKRIKEVMDFAVPGAIRGHVETPFPQSIPITRTPYIVQIPTGHYSPNFWATLFMFHAVNTSMLAHRFKVASSGDRYAQRRLPEIATKNMFELADFASDGRLKKVCMHNIQQLVTPSGIPASTPTADQVFEDINSRIFGEDLATIDPGYRSNIKGFMQDWLLVLRGTVKFSPQQQKLWEQHFRTGVGF